VGYLARHVLGLVLFGLFLFAPLPFGLWVVGLGERAGRGFSLPQAVLAVLAVWCLVQSAVAHALGLLHLLHLPAMVAAEVVVLAAGAIGLRRRDGRALALLLRRPRIGPLEKLTLLALAVMGATLLWRSAAMPVVDWDSWSFHMPAMAGWLQSGTFSRMEQYSARPRNSYPYGWEALCALFMKLFGEDLLVTFPNVVAWVSIGLATYLLARMWRARRIHALACAALLLSIPYVADPVNTMHVDLPFAALVMTSVYFGALYGRSGDLVGLGLGAATLGLACATRTTAPLYAVLVLAWIWFVRLREGATAPPGEGEEDGARTVAYGGVALGIVLGAFWFTKNLIESGHIFGPGAPTMETVPGRASWVQMVNEALALNFNLLEAASWRAVIDRAGGELGVPFLALALLSALWPVAWLLRRESHAAAGTSLLLLLLWTGVVFWITPLSGLSRIQVRLGLPFLAALAVAAGVGATRMKLRGDVSVAVVLLAAARTFSGSRVFYLLALLAVVGGVASGAGLIPRPRSRALAVVGIALFAVAVTLAARERRERERRAVYGPTYAYLEDHVPPAEPVAYLYCDRSYILSGRALARPLIYAPPVERASSPEWAERLRRQSVKFVAVGPWSDNHEEIEGALAQLTVPNGPLTLLSGTGDGSEISLYRLEPQPR